VRRFDAAFAVPSVPHLHREPTRIYAVESLNLELFFHFSLCSLCLSGKFPIHRYLLLSTINCRLSTSFLRVILIPTRRSFGMKTVPAPWCARATFTKLVALAAALLLLAAAAPAQTKDKKNKKNPPLVNNDSGNPVVPMSDEQQIDYMISEWLGAWQLGDIEKLHNDTADDISVVSGVWTPPIFGWQSYLAVYQQQHARTQQIRLDRYNTYIKTHGDVAWACYQWDFSGTVDGQPMSAQGQTTLVMEKRGTRWVIVHNHTSLTPPANTPAQGPATGAPPTQPQQKPPAH
jgi:ketosteroid isomerase-like protein